MIDFNETIIRKLIVHRISNDAHKSSVSDNLYNYQNEEEEEILKKIFLKPFASISATNEFTHKINIALNPLFKISQAIFEDEDFIGKSKDIFTHLKSVSKHPNIKDGDLFIVKYDDIKMDNGFYEALGIYKIENKERFIETTTRENGEIGLNFKSGIGGKRLDKACLIVFNKVPYTLLVIDNGAVETEYWKNDFLSVDYKNDYINSTNQFMALTKSFVTDRFPVEHQVTKADQIDLLNRSVNYFKSNETFSKQAFEKDVLLEESVINSFRDFDSAFREAKGIDLKDDFEISRQAVKKQAKIFKNVLKLDRNFDIYIHGDKSLIEHGVEKDGRKYYKIYYNHEL
ncbi:nucleoid-associated protein [Telluribacter sp.]|jgi:hypothetical protein|uniref:nucleoid-associated protein n=1 Tax=Telluribacter sp. TaxID=1978767 RepID=UPI002E0DA660|nr:nucleoid-associated protein [Telluribacter sp.]